jgi:hypothetical protein
MACKAGLSFIGVVAAVVLAATGCGGSTTTSDSPSTSPSTSAAPAATSAPADATTAPAGAKVSANTASDSEIESALSAAGVSNAARWAHEVVEYRPHPADDPNLTKLRENLAKYNPGQETVDKIVSALTP